jgi:hypothetical protein
MSTHDIDLPIRDRGRVTVDRRFYAIRRNRTNVWAIYMPQRYRGIHCSMSNLDEIWMILMWSPQGGISYVGD